MLAAPVPAAPARRAPPRPRPDECRAGGRAELTPAQEADPAVRFRASLTGPYGPVTRPTTPRRHSAMSETIQAGPPPTADEPAAHRTANNRLGRVYALQWEFIR